MAIRRPNLKTSNLLYGCIYLLCMTAGMIEPAQARMTQQKTAMPGEEARDERLSHEVLMRFIYICDREADSDDPEITPIFCYLNNNRVETVRLHANVLSPLFFYQGDPPVSLFAYPIDQAMTPSPSPGGQLTFPSDWQGVLFLVTDDARNPLLPFRFTALEYWGPSIPDNHARIINLSPVETRIRLANFSTTLSAYQHVDTPIHYEQSGELPVHLTLLRQHREQTVLSTSFPQPSSGKLYIVIYPDSADFHTARVLVLDQLPGLAPNRQP